MLRLCTVGFILLIISSLHNYVSLEQSTCKENEFDCGEEENGTRCIPIIWRCNQLADCSSTQKDEKGCKHYKLCPEGRLLCKNGNCVSEHLKCDQVDDCGDGSDEAGCSGTILNFHCPDEGDWFRCIGGPCIPISARCDGKMDCPEEEDEEGCSGKQVTRRPLIVCLADEFECDNRCVPTAWRCDGIADCQDGTDENNEMCEAKPPEDEFLRFGLLLPKSKRDIKSNCSLGKGQVGFQCDGGKCILMENVCDSKQDCFDGTDEGGHCGECQYLHCSHKCIDHPEGPRCWCPGGRKLSYDGQTCEDINECLTSEGNKCSQQCINLDGSYRCGCVDKYILAADMHHCVAEVDPYASIFFSTGTEILQLPYHRLRNESSVERFDYSREHRKFIHSLSFNQRLNRMYYGYSDVQNHQACIFVSKGNKPQCLVSDLDGLVNVAVDWITNNVYYTSQYPSKLPGISVCRWNGRYCRLLVPSVSGREYYRSQTYHGFVLNPKFASMFWIDMTGKMNLPRIMSSMMDGTKLNVFMDTFLGKPQGLALDHIRQKLYFCDTTLQMVFRIDIATKQRMAIMSEQGVRYPYEMLFFDDSLYWIDWGTYSLMTHKVDSSDHSYALRTAPTMPYGLAINHTAFTDDKVRNPCEDKRCSHICVLTSEYKNLTARCVCANNYIEQENGECKEVKTKSVKVPKMCLQLRVQYCRRGILCLNDGECWTKRNSSGHIYDTKCNCRAGFTGPFCDSVAVLPKQSFPMTTYAISAILVVAALTLMCFLIGFILLGCFPGIAVLFEAIHNRFSAYAENVRNTSLNTQHLLSEDQQAQEDRQYEPGRLMEIDPDISAFLNVPLGVIPIGPPTEEIGGGDDDDRPVDSPEGRLRHFRQRRWEDE